MAFGNSSFDEILSTTLKNYVPRLTDNIFSARPLFYALTNGQTMRRIGGGAKIVVPVLGKTNGTAASYSGTDTISTTASDGMTAAEYDWGQYAVTVTISGIEEAKNNGEEQIIDLLEGKIFQAQETVISNMNAMLFSNGEGNTQKDWNGIGNLVQDGAVTNSNGAAQTRLRTIGGIDSSDSDNAWWRSTVTDHTTNSGNLSLAAMGTLYNTVSVGNDQPTIIMTSQQGYEAYEALLTSNVRYTDTDMANSGFQNLMFKGAPVVFDDDCPAGTDQSNHSGSGRVYMLNTKYIQLVAHSDVWFKPTPFVRPTNQDSVFSQILCYGQLTISNRARQGFLDNVLDA
jgi:hypothetical protein